MFAPRVRGDAVMAGTRTERMESALRQLRQWDMLDACADGPWAKRLIDAALADAGEVSPSPATTDDSVCPRCHGSGKEPPAGPIPVIGGPQCLACFGSGTTDSAHTVLPTGAANGGNWPVSDAGGTPA